MRRWIVLWSCALLASVPVAAGAVQVHPSARAAQPEIRHIRADAKLVIDVWTDRGDGAVYHAGDPIRVHFRASRDCYAVLYNIDSEGKINLLYPYRRMEPHWVEAGREYSLPGAEAGYDLQVDGPAGIEYIQALASLEPFQQLPDYMGADFDPADDVDSEGSWRDGDKVVGDPFIGMERINRSILPYDCEEQDCYAAAYTNFYVEHKVNYPRYVCADCHGPYATTLYDPYSTQCSVFEIRVDYDWRWRRNYPFYRNPYWYYFRRTDCPPQFFGYKQRWSSNDGWVHFKDTFGEKVIWKRNPGQDPKLGGGGGSGGFGSAGGGGNGGNNVGSGGGRFKTPPTPGKPPAGDYRPGEGRRSVRRWPISLPVTPVPADDQPVRFRSRSHDVAPPPRFERRPPVEQAPPAKKDDSPAPAPRERGSDRGDGRVRERVAPEDPKSSPASAPAPREGGRPRDPKPQEQPREAPKDREADTGGSQRFHGGGR